MPEEQQVPISSFPDASSIDGADTVTGLQNNVNTNFKFSTILAWLVNAFRSAFVPAGRTVNNKSLATDITLNASDVGARPDNWTPSAADVTYDNTGSGLSASDVQDALDELAAGAGGSTAASTSYDNTGSGLAATNAQDALDELSDEKADQITVAPVETSTTASAAHGLGSVFYLGGKLYRALADIAAGGTINTAAGGNATETSIAQSFKRTVTLTSAQYAQLSAAEKAADILYIITDEPDPSAYTSNPEMDGTASPGSSEAWARGDHVHPSDSSKQDSITASGILKGDGAGGVSAATPGTDYQAPLTAGTDYATPAQLADKAAQQDLTSIQATGTTNNTGAVIPAGALFYLNGILHRAKTQIDANATFTPGTNCEQATVTEEIQKKSIFSTTSTRSAILSFGANARAIIFATSTNAGGRGIFSMSTDSNSAASVSALVPGNAITMTSSGSTIIVSSSTNVVYEILMLTGSLPTIS